MKLAQNIILINEDDEMVWYVQQQGKDWKKIDIEGEVDDGERSIFQLQIDGSSCTKGLVVQVFIPEEEITELPNMG